MFYKKYIFYTVAAGIAVFVLLTLIAVFWIRTSSTPQASSTESTLIEKEPSKESPFDIEKFMAGIRYAESFNAPRLTGNETEEELYNNPYIQYIRTGLNGYLAGTSAGAEETALNDEDGICGLGLFDKAYYQSKFVVIAAADSEYGGVAANIVFVDKPDTIFWALVYRLGGDGEYILRGFCRSGPPEDKRAAFEEYIAAQIQNTKFKL